MEKNLIELFQSRTGYVPNLAHPQTYCEKCLWVKMNDKDPRIIRYADKIEAKNIVRGSGIEPIPTLAIDPPGLRQFPVMARVNNRSGSSRVIKNRRDWKRFKRTVPLEPYGVEKGEWHYQHIPTRVLVEPIITDFFELKFFCFNGRVTHLLHVGTNQHRTFYTREGEFLNIRQSTPKGRYSPKKTVLPSYRHVIPWVEKLAASFGHVRVDLMLTEKQVFLSEFTFFHFSGMLEFEPKTFDYELGKDWDPTR